MRFIDRVRFFTQEKINKKEKLALVVYLVIGILIVFSLIRQAVNKNYFNVLLCAFSLVLITLPLFIESKTRIEFPQTLEIITICFVFAAEILGEISNFYFHIPVWDSILHIITGCLSAAVGFGAIDLINTHAKRITMTPFFVVAVAFCFSMTIAVFWEFFEFGVDSVLRTDMQKDTYVSGFATVTFDETCSNVSVPVDDVGKTFIVDSSGKEIVSFDGYLDIGLIDTMKDMFVNMIGAVVFSVYAYLYSRKKSKYKFIENIIIKEKEL
ncbi:MAG: hypothetical protein IJM94_00435 [Clostridia bacterium]|nr:hypothetical protein [Clostridia bacterium]MBQ7075245.1 hypothetical protein [Clostridia bacterium]